jgi:protease secretion system outer membrane protein
LIKIESYRAAERSALTALEASKKGFHAGIRVNLDILNAIQQLHSVQKDLAEASYGYLLARLRLSFHAGAVSINDIMQVSLLMKESDQDPERGADDRG